MPFRSRCRITLENQHPAQPQRCFYQINYTLTDVPDDAAYFHAQFRRANPQPYGEEFTIVDGIRGHGHYVGTSLGWGVLDDRWWGEGEIKFFLDGDQEFPTICGTGTEDYVGGAYDWSVAGEYRTYTTPFLGMHQVIQPDGHMLNKHRHAMYRFHVLDPIPLPERPARHHPGPWLSSRPGLRWQAVRCSWLARTTSVPWPTGTRPCRPRPSRRFRIGCS